MNEIDFLGTYVADGEGEGSGPGSPGSGGGQCDGSPDCGCWTNDCC